MKMKGLINQWRMKKDKWRKVNFISLKSFQTNSLHFSDKGLIPLRAIQIYKFNNAGNMFVEDKKQ